MKTNLINVCVLGEKGTGKTVYSKTLCNKEYKNINSKPHPTISDTYYSLRHSNNNKEYKINLIDTVGSDFIYEDTISKCTAFILMFQFNNIESFNNIPMYIKMIRNSNKISSPIVIVGNMINNSSNKETIINYKKELKSYGIPFIFINSCCEYKQVIESFELLLNIWEKKYDINYINNNNNIGKQFNSNNSIKDIYQSFKQSKNNLFKYINKLL